jgi:transposase
VIRVDALWLACELFDMRAGTETALARVVAVFGEAKPHHAYLFANRRAMRMKVLVHDGIGVWLAARRLNRGSFVWPPSAMPACATGPSSQLQCELTPRLQGVSTATAYSNASISDLIDLAPEKRIPC